MDNFSILEEKEEHGSESGDGDSLESKAESKSEPKSVARSMTSESVSMSSHNPALMERKMAPTVWNSGLSLNQSFKGSSYFAYNNIIKGLGQPPA